MIEFVALKLDINIPVMNHVICIHRGVTSPLNHICQINTKKNHLEACFLHFYIYM